MGQKPSVGRVVHFAPPQECVGPASLTCYPAMITQVNPDETVELVTFGPNSVYFQHGISFSDEPKPGCWSWPPRI